MEIAITGASGLIGTALTDSLRNDGHRVAALVRRDVAAGADEIRWDPSGRTIDSASLEGFDAVIHLAGAGIGDKRWTDERKKLILDSRVDGTSLLANALAGLDRAPSVLLSASGTGYYGDRGDEVLDETANKGSGFLSDVVEAWEDAAQPAAEAGIRTAYLRTSPVLTADGGVLKRQLPFFKLGLGGRIGSGRQYFPWISLRDQIGAIEFLLAGDVDGPVNLVAPEPVTNLEFTKTLGGVLRRPTLLPVPTFGPKLIFGGELVEQLILVSTRAVPGVLESAGFTFEDPALEPALRHLLDS
ncbi:MAG: TIGR01777 family oxidoreductase [Actinomycetota bacterium]